MKSSRLISEFSLSALLLVLVSLCLEPVQARWMPTMLANGVLLSVIAAFIVFAVFIWKEKAPDERAEQHRLAADRIAFLTGAGILVFGVLWQTWHHGQNIWLLSALVGMVLSKLGALVYQEMRR